MKKRNLNLIGLLAVVVILVSACAPIDNEKLTASGTFSAIETIISPELSGKVVSIYVNEGDQVTEGQTLFKMDTEMLQAQYAQAEAAVKAAEAAADSATQQAASAEAQYKLALQASLVQDIPAQQTLLQTTLPENYRPVWYFSQYEQIAAAEIEVEDAQEQLDSAQKALEDEQVKASNKDFFEVENRLANAQLALSVAQSTQNQFSSTSVELEDASDELVRAAQAEFDSALAEYQRLLTSTSADALVQARSRVAVAQANLNNARSSLFMLQTGEQSLQVIAAQKATQAAESGVKQAQAMLEQANTALSMASIQLAWAEVKSPVSGTILSRNLEVGDLAVAGGSVMRVAQLDTLDLVVYLPEDRYGRVDIGDSVKITVDSFDNEIFEGTVISIANEAEFTPRNVQTENGRKATVYAIKIQIDNLDHRLKPGMPADVEFIVE